MATAASPKLSQAWQAFTKEPLSRPDSPPALSLNDTAPSKDTRNLGVWSHTFLSTSQQDTLSSVVGPEGSLVFLEAIWAVVLGRLRDSEEVEFAIVDDFHRKSEQPGSCPLRYKHNTNFDTDKLLRDVIKDVNYNLYTQQSGDRTDSEDVFDRVDSLVFIINESTCMEKVSRELDRSVPVKLLIHLGQEQFVILQASEESFYLPAQKLLEIYIAALDSALQSINDAKFKIAQIELLDEAAKSEALERGQAKHKPCSPTTIVALFKERVSQQPDAIAVRSEEGTSLSYSQLDNMAESISKEASLSPSTIVAVCMDRSPEFIATLLAIMMSGAAYTILDPEGAKDRNQSIVDQCKCKTVFTNVSYKDYFPSTLVIDEILSKNVAESEAPAIEPISKRDTTHKVSPEDLAYIQFTSGSSGVPKGAMLTHEAATNGIQCFSLNGCKNWLLFYNPIFSAAQRTMFATLVHGATVCVATKERITTALDQVIQNLKVDALGVTPTALSLLHPDSVTGLKQISLVGENLPQHLVETWATRYRLRQTYGLSEVTQINFGRQLKKADDGSRIGRPQDTTSAYVLLPDSNALAPVRVSGELCLAGPQLAIGYIGQPGETASKFVDNPFGEGKLYRTGDAALENDDGSLSILGRIDFQVKINGQRVEPKEVDAILQKHSDVEECATVGITVQNRKVLVSGVHLKHDLNWTDKVDSLRDHASQNLPQYMRPSFWYPLAQIPRNGAGKINLGELRKMFQSLDPSKLREASRGSNDTFEAVEDESEKQIRDIWASVLDIESDEIGRSDSFAALGGSSVEAIKVVSQLRNAGFFLELEHLIKPVSLSDIASKASKGDVETSDPEPFETLTQDDLTFVKQYDNVEDAFYATPLQESVVAATMNGADHYLYARVWDISGLDLEQLKSAFKTVFKANPILRSTFLSGGERLIQAIKTDIEPSWSNTDTRLKKLLSSPDFKKIELEQPFVKLVLVSGKLLVVGMHHALFDYWSHRFIYDDVANVYQGNDPITRPNFARFAKHLSKIDKEEMKVWWAEYLDGAEASIINNSPTDTTAQVQQVVPINIRKRLQAHGLGTGAAIYTAWALVLAQYNNSTDVSFATTFSGRDVPVVGIEQMDGPSLTTVPQRVRFDESSNIVDLAKLVQDGLFELNRHSQHGMRNALKDGKLNGESIDSLVNLLIKDSDTPVGLDVLKTHGRRPIWQSEFTTLEVEDTGDTIETRLSTTLPQFRAEFILDAFVQALNHLLDQADGSVMELSIIGKKEEAFLLSSQTYEEPAPELLHSRFEGIAARNPSIIAIDWDGERQVSYAELNTMATKLAHFLLNQGVRPKSAVPLLFDKSVDTIAAIMAVLKCGAHYVPMDPKNPIERNAFIVKETEAKIVFAHDTYADLADDLGAQMVFFESADLQDLPAERPDVTVEPADTAYMIYTSGSSGTPKGTMVPHNSAAAAVTSMLEVEGRYEGSWRVLQFANYVFDASVQDIFNTLSSGGTLCMAPTEKLMSELNEVIARLEIDAAILTPTVAKLINPDDVPTMRTIILGGEPLRQEIIDEWVPERKLLNVYGPTETSMVVTTKDVGRKDSPKNIGKPFKTAFAVILHPESSRLVPYGGIGELAIGGPQVTKGYLKNFEMTRKAYVSGTELGFNKIYRTGDIVRWLNNGELACYGRKDSQIKIHGHRIELGEVETAINRTEVFHDAAVFAAKKGGDAQLVAFVEIGKDTGNEVEPADDHKDLIEELNGHLEMLTPYMRPKVVIPVGQFPKLPSGKVNRKKLQQWLDQCSKEELQSYSAAGGSSKEVIPPSDDKEKTVVELAGKLFDIDASTFGVEANFTSLGGDSVSAITLSSMARKEGLNLSVNTILSVDTLKDMAAKAVELTAAEDSAAEVKPFEAPKDIIDRLDQAGVSATEDIDYMYPCPPGQAAFLEWGSAETQLWCLMAVRELPEYEDVDKWKSCTEELTRLNDILRTTWTKSSEGQWVGIVLNDETISLPVMEYSGDDQRDSIIDKFWNERFEFGKAFIKYLVLQSKDDSKHREIAVKLDHGMYDGTLFRIFGEQFLRIQKGHHIPAHPQFRGFTEHVWNYPKDHLSDFWKGVMSEYPVKGFKANVENPNITGAVAQTTDIELDKLCKPCNVTPSIVFQAAFQLWLHHRMSTEDVGFDYLLSGRNVDLDNPQMINGNLANFLPFRSTIDTESENVKAYLKRTQDFFWAATEKGLVCLSEAYEAASLDWKATPNKVLFLFQPFDPPKPQPPNTRPPMPWVVLGKSRVVKMIQPYALVVEASKTLSGHKLKVQFDENLFNKEDAENVAREVIEIAEKLVEQGPEAGLGEYVS